MVRFKNKQHANMFANQDPAELRTAVYKTILSVDELAEGDNPTQIKDTHETPEEQVVFGEMSRAIKEAMKILPPREKEFIEAKFFDEKNCVKWLKNIIFRLRVFLVLYNRV